MSSFVGFMNNILYQPYIVPLFLIAVGIYFTIRTKAVQIRLFPEMFRVIMEKTENEKAMQEVGQRLLQLSQSAMKQQAYNDWHIVINESLVRAAVIVYLYENGFNQFVSSMLNVETMQNGFPWMLDVVSALRYYSTHREQYPTLNDFYPEIARFLSK